MSALKTNLRIGAWNETLNYMQVDTYSPLIDVSEVIFSVRNVSIQRRSGEMILRKNKESQGATLYGFWDEARQENSIGV